jgi:hypothetical protein
MSEDLFLQDLETNYALIKGRWKWPGNAMHTRLYNASFPDRLKIVVIMSDFVRRKGWSQVFTAGVPSDLREARVVFAYQYAYSEYQIGGNPSDMIISMSFYFSVKDAILALRSTQIPRLARRAPISRLPLCIMRCLKSFLV